MLLLTLGLATTFLANWTTAKNFGILPALGLSQPWRLATGFLALDAWAYFWHRANHASPFLWRFHRLHHSDHEMDCTTSARFHCGELAIAAATRLPVIALVGLEPVTLLVHETALVAVSQFHHAEIRLGRWDRFLRWFIVTPAMHRIHHSRERTQTNSNYASILAVWDSVFHSFQDPEAAGEVRVGLEEYHEEQWHSLPRMLIMPFAESPAAGPTYEERPNQSPPEKK